ncbi:hypothetical protein ABT288_00345 [Streptomyces sp. NPDC001093]|uniref:hypothetical protein n=1 Tax=Streptomyces sp. NPDC001093 TaxID=3154376 RepID=UPI0033243BB6
MARPLVSTPAGTVAVTVLLLVSITDTKDGAKAHRSRGGRLRLLPARLPLRGVAPAGTHVPLEDGE